MVYQDEAEKRIISALRKTAHMSAVELHRVSGLSEPRFTSSTLQALCHEGLVIVQKVEGRDMYHLASGLGFGLTDADADADDVKPVKTVPAIPVPPPSPKPALSTLPEPEPVKSMPALMPEPVKPPPVIPPEQRSSRHVGIYPSTSKARPWRATANLHGRTFNLGTFVDERSAVEARKQFLANPPPPPPGKRVTTPKPTPAPAPELPIVLEPMPPEPPKVASPIEEMVGSIVDRMIKQELERRLRL